MNPRFVHLLISCWIFTVAGAYNLTLKGDFVQKEIILARYYGQSLLPVDTTKAINQQAIFKAGKSLDQGMYAFIVQEETMDVLITDEQNLVCEMIPDDGTHFLKVDGSQTSAHFAGYGHYIYKLQQQRNQMLNAYRPYQNNPDSLASLRKQLDAMTVEIETFYKNGIKEYKGTLLGQIYSMLRQPEAPAMLPSSQQHQYLKNHFFDAIDFSDPHLVNTPMYEHMLQQYLNKQLDQVPDTLVKYSTRLIDASLANREVFKQTCNHVFSYAAGSNVMGMDKLLVVISKRYYLSNKAFWVDDNFKQKLATRVRKSEPTILGATAPNINLMQQNEEQGFVSLHDIRAKYTLLVFWEPDCGHCEQAVPAIEKVTEKYPATQLSVYAVCTQNDVKAWSDFIFEHDLHAWINVYDKFNQSNYKSVYDISGTPYLLLLDDQKRILAKQFPFQALDKMLVRLQQTGSIF